MYPNHMPDIMILAQAVIEFVHKVALPYKMPKSEKGHTSNSAKYTGQKKLGIMNFNQNFASQI